MNISLLNILRTVSWDFRRDMAQGYANALRNAIELHIENDVEKQEGFFLSKKGYTSKKDHQVHGANFMDKLMIGNIHRIENHLRWNDEELADDDEIIDVVCIDGPVTRDGGGCSYGSKDWRDQVMYANTIPQVIGHIFVVNTPGGESACRNDYDLMIADCRKNNKPTVTFVDGMCCSSGVNLSCRTDRTIVMNPKDEFGCIGSMAAFWATPDGAKDIDGSRYIEIVGNESPDKNGWYRDAANGDYEKLQALIDKDTNEFHQTVRENRPLVEDWMLTGETFKAEELMPGLVDEIGDFNRAIECVQLLAAGQLPLARDAKKEEAPTEPTEPTNPNEPTDPDEPKMPKPEPEVPEGPEDEPEVSSNEGGQKNEMSKLNKQQKAAVSARPGATMIVNNGHVKEVVETPFGPMAHEIAKPQNHKEMTDEEKKKAQQAQQAAEEPKADPNKKEDEPKKNDPNENPEADPNEKKPDENPEGDPDVNPEENPGGEEPAEEPDNEPENEPEGDPDDKPDDDPDDPDDDPDDPKKKKEDDPDDKCGGGEPKKDDNDNDACDPNKKSEGEGADELAHTKDALHNAESLVAERDKTIKAKDSKIAELQKQLEEKSKDNSKKLAALAERDKSIKELADTVAALKKQINELSGEVKELAAEPAPMIDESAGVPKNNGTGVVETGPVKSIVTANMDVKEIRERLRKQDKELAEKRRHR